MAPSPLRPPQVCVLGSAEPGSEAFALAGAAGECLAGLGITVVSGGGSPATREAARRAQQAGGTVLGILPDASLPAADWPATVVVPSGLGAGRNLLMALAGDACVVIGGRAGTLSEVALAWLHHRPLLPLVGHGGWSDQLPGQPPDERQSAPILPWDSVDALARQLQGLGLVRPPGHAAALTDAALVDLERRRTAALVQRDMVTIEQLHAPGYELVSPSGRVFSRADYLGALARGPFYAGWEVTAPKVHRGQGWAQIRYTALLAFPSGHSHRCCHTDSYEWRDGRWQALWSQATKLGD